MGKKRRKNSQMLREKEKKKNCAKRYPRNRGFFHKSRKESNQIYSPYIARKEEARGEKR